MVHEYSGSAECLIERVTHFIDSFDGVELRFIAMFRYLLQRLVDVSERLERDAHFRPDVYREQEDGCCE